MKTILSAICLLLAISVQATDLAKEKRWAEQVEDSLLDGEAISLNDGANNFLGIITTAENPKANIIVIHGIGAHPDWPQVINPVRVSLAEAGFNTLSIQVSILANDADPADYNKIMDEVAPRIKAALGYFDKCCKATNYIVAHSMGARMASFYLNGNKNSKVARFVAIGMNKNVDVSKISIPILEIYGEFDLTGVLESIPKRKAILSEPSKQIMIKGADHFMEGHEQELVSLISKWLEQ